MESQKSQTRNIVLVLMIIVLTAIRLFTLKYQLWSNCVPAGAMAIFSGFYFKEKWKAYTIILVTFFVSNIFIDHAYTGVWNLWSTYNLWYFVCFSLIVFVGSLIKKINFATGLLILLAPVAIHWLVMDLPWVNTPALYPNTLAGYGTALIAALPFEKNMLLGDALFGLVLFGGFELAKSKYTVLRGSTKMAA